MTPQLYPNNFRKIKSENYHRISMQNIKYEIRNKIICININAKIINIITLIIGHNFLDLTIPNNRDLTIKIEIFRIYHLKSYTYQFHKIILKNYQITSKNYEIKYRQNRTLYKT